MSPPTPPKKGNRFPRYFGLAASLLFVFLAHQDPLGFIGGIENKWGDLMFRVRGIVPGCEKLQIVAIDDYSIGAIEPFPWRRGVYARIIRKLVKLGVRTIAFDVLYLDPNRNDPKGDAELVRASLESGRAIHLYNLEHQNVGSRTIITLGRPGLKGLVEASAMMTHPYVSGVLDRDGVLRRAELYDFSTNEPIPVLGAGVWLHYAGRPIDDLGAFPDIIRLNMRGEILMPTFEVRTSTKGAFHFVHAASLFRIKPELQNKADLGDLDNDDLTPEERRNFKDGIALIGSTAVGAFDHYPSPSQELTPGVILHANIFDSLWRGDYLRDGPVWLTLLLTLAMVWAAVGLMSLQPWAASSLAFVILMAWAAGDYLLFLRNWRLPFIAPAGAFTMSFAALLIHRVITEGREKRWIKNTFGQYLSPKVVDSLVADPDKLKLGGEKRDMSVFFLDIAHFTTISEKMTPEALTQFLNEYLSAFTDIILRNDGVVDKYIGDCVMAFWNAPVDQPRHRALAALSAIECLEATERLNRSYVDPAIPEPPAVRIGLNAGHVVVGNMGSRTRFSYTVIGDEVNLASRLEGANKFFGTHLMASEAVYEGAREHVEAREIGRIRVVGKAVPIRVFELLAKKGELPEEKRKTLDLYNEGIRYYADRRFPEAAERFKTIVQLAPGDKLAKMYLCLSEDYVALPPPADWDGVFNLTSK